MCGTLSLEMADEVTPHFIALMAFNKMNLFGVSDSLYTRIVNQVGVDGSTARGCYQVTG